MAAAAVAADEAGDGDAADVGAQPVVLGEQLGRNVRRRPSRPAPATVSSSASTAAASAVGDGARPRLASATIGVERSAVGVGQLGVERLDLLHELEHLVLELELAALERLDIVLEGLELLGRGDVPP